MSDRILTLKSCAVRGPRGEKGDTGLGILRVSVTNLSIQSYSGDITAATFSKTYADIRAAVEACRPVELYLADNGYGDILHLDSINNTSLRFSKTWIDTPEDPTRRFTCCFLYLDSDGTVQGSYIKDDE